MWRFFLCSLFLVSAGEVEYRKCVRGVNCLLSCPWADALWTEWENSTQSWKNVSVGAEFDYTKWVLGEVKLRCSSLNESIDFSLLLVRQPYVNIVTKKLETGGHNVSFNLECSYTEGEKVSWSFEENMFATYVVVDKNSIYGVLPLNEERVTVYCSVYVYPYRYRSYGLDISLSGGRHKERCGQDSEGKYYLMNFVGKPAKEEVQTAQVNQGSYDFKWLTVEGLPSYIRFFWNEGSPNYTVQIYKLGEPEKLIAAENGTCQSYLQERSVSCASDYFGFKPVLADAGSYEARKGLQKIPFSLSVHRKLVFEVMVYFYGENIMRFACRHRGGSLQWGYGWRVIGQYHSKEQIFWGRLIVHCPCYQTVYPSHGATGYPTCRFRVSCFGSNEFGTFTSAEVLIDNYYIASKNSAAARSEL
ncbi:protein ORF5 [Lizard adenovirus 2]|uniref:Protein ORF5 n=1 Tax=Lizard adenovirus 2 TaxID=874272 RepID=A0A076FYX0_9ADEN|nr:protein ORF5 [Lizard adenovirus 2]AII22586.1 protein ORF5 [Lizard adenovirus 2]